MTGKWLKPPEATGFRIVPYCHFEASYASKLLCPSYFGLLIIKCGGIAIKEISLGLYLAKIHPRYVSLGSEKC